MASNTRISWLCVFVSVMVSATNAITLFNNLPARDFQEFKKSPFVRVVYFYKHNDVPRLQNFLDNFKESSEILQDYGVKTGIVNCKEDPVKEFCERKHPIESHILIFKSGYVMTELGLDSMFSVDAIMSNILQMVLLGEVPIVQNSEELNTIMKLSKGQKDVLFSYQKAVGTYEHRIFMEVAFVYGQKYKFAFTTSADVISTISTFDVRTPSIWFLQCSAAKKTDETCPVLRYTGPMNLVTSSRYMKLISIPNVIDLKPDNAPAPFGDLNIHQAYIFTNYELYTETKNTVEDVAKDFIGLVGFAIVNVEDKMFSRRANTANAVFTKLGYGSKVKSVPSVTMKVVGSEGLSAMEIQFTSMNLKNFINDKIITYSEDNQEEYIETEEESIDALFEVPPEEIQDDPIAEDAYLLRRKKVTSPHIPALTDKTSPEFIHNKAVGLIMFYVDWDAKAQVFMEQYAMAGEELAKKTNDATSPLARVNCADWPDVCENNNVTRYPTFKLFKEMKLHSDYEGKMDKDSVVKFVSLHLLESPVVLRMKADVESFITGTYPSIISGEVETLVLGLFAEDTDKEAKAFTKVGKQLHGQYLLGYIVGPVAKEIASRFETDVPSVVVVKLNDKLQPYIVLPEKLQTEEMIASIKQSSLPTFGELKASNFVAYQSLQRPFVILFGTTKDINGQTSQVIGEIAKSGQFSDFIFCWMNLDDDSSMGNYILHSYITEPAIPSVVMVNHKEGKVYSYPQPYDITNTGISKWLDLLKGGKITNPTSEFREGKWKPMMPGYDFLFFIDTEMGMNKAPEEREFRSGGIIRPKTGKEFDMQQAEAPHAPPHTEL